MNLTTVKIVQSPYPHKKAWLVIPHPNSKNQRWVIKYKAWDKISQSLRLCRETECNSIEDLNQRQEYCDARIKEINKQLANGAYYSPELAKKQEFEQTVKENPKLIGIYNALDLGLESRQNSLKEIRLRSLETLIQRKNRFQLWLKNTGFDSLSADDFTEELFMDFLIWLKNEYDVSDRTLNNYLTDCKTLFFYMRKHKARLIKSNPLELIERLPTGIGRNHAYNVEQENAIIELTKNTPELRKYHLLAMVMYNTILRTNEISHLKRANIDNPRKGLIFLPGKHVKNKYDRTVEITPELDQVFKEFGIYDLDRDFYLFSKRIQPGREYNSGDYLGLNYRKYVLSKLNFPMDYTLYSWRHTAVVKATLLGIPDARIMMQGGWRDVTSYQKYKKSLCLMDNSDFKFLFPKMGV